MHMKLTHLVGGSAVAAVFVIGLVLGSRGHLGRASLSVGAINSLPAEPPVLAPPRVVQQTMSTQTATMASSSSRGMTMDPVTLPLPSAVQFSSVIAEVRVESIQPSQFNTDNGLLPSVPLEDDPMEDDDPAWIISRIADLRVLNVLKGDPASTIYVTQMLGGTVGGHTLSVGGTTLSRMVIGSEGMVFVYGHVYDDTATLSSSIPWAKHAAQRVDQLHQGSETARFLMPSAVYLYDASGNATSSEFAQISTPINDLRTQVQTLLLTPTATPSPTPTPTPTP